MADPFLTVELPWPSNKLSPNTRQQHHALAKAKRNYRAACKNKTRDQFGVVRMPAQELKYRLLFFPPTKRSYDRDNLVARMKSGLDGMCDSLRIDDSIFVESAARVLHQVDGGRVLVEIAKDHTGEWVTA